MTQKEEEPAPDVNGHAEEVEEGEEEAVKLEQVKEKESTANADAEVILRQARCWSVKPTGVLPVDRCSASAESERFHPVITLRYSGPPGDISASVTRPKETPAVTESTSDWKEEKEKSKRSSV